MVVRACDPTTSGVEIAIKLLPRGGSRPYLGLLFGSVSRPAYLLKHLHPRVCASCRHELSNVSRGIMTDLVVCASGVTAGDFVKTFKSYVKREIVHHGSLKHPFVVSLKEVSVAIFKQSAGFCRS